MVSIVSGVIGMIVLIPFLSKLKLPFSKKGKFILIFASGLLAGMANFLYQILPLWQLIVLMLSVTYLLTLLLSRGLREQFQNQFIDEKLSFEYIKNTELDDDDKGVDTQSNIEDLVQARSEVAASSQNELDFLQHRAEDHQKDAVE